MAGQKERDQYLDTMEDLVGHPGWRLLEEECRVRIYQCQADALDDKVAKNWDNVNYLRGVAATLAELVRLPEVLATQRANAVEDKE